MRKRFVFFGFCVAVLAVVLVGVHFGWSFVQPGVTHSASQGMWLSKDEILKLPISGAAWDALKQRADQLAGTPNLSNEEDPTNVHILAKALVFARIGGESYLQDVEKAIQSIVDSGTYQGTALALGRELGAYVVSADLIDLGAHNPSLHSSFKVKLQELLTTPTTGGGVASLVKCHEKRPNNWGTHCGATRLAIALYLQNTKEIARVAKVFKGWLGDRSSYSGFSYGDDKSWQCDPTKPVGINRQGCIKEGHSIDGVLADDQRRAGPFIWPAPKENYVWGALQGAVFQAELLHRAGYDAWNWENKALLRALQWLYNEASYPAQGDDTWIPYLVNRAYGVNLGVVVPARPGKNMGWTDWTHQPGI